VPVVDGDTGGNVQITMANPDQAISIGQGGRATVYTGSVRIGDGYSRDVVESGDNVGDGLVEWGAGRVRYGSDETTQRFGAGLGGGVYAVFRERPEIDISASDQAIVYGQQPALSVLRDGDTEHGDTLTQAIPGMGSEITVEDANGDQVVAEDNGTAYFDVGTYDLVVAEQAIDSSALGYKINSQATDEDGNPRVLTVSPRDLLLKANDDAKFKVEMPEGTGYTYNGVAVSGMADGEQIITLKKGEKYFDGIIIPEGDDPASINLQTNATHHHIGTMSITRSNDGTNKNQETVSGNSVGTYDLELNAESITLDNYNETVEDGAFTVVAANELLVRTGTLDSTYGDERTYRDDDATAEFVSQSVELASVDGVQSGDIIEQTVNGKTASGLVVEVDTGNNTVTLSDVSGQREFTAEDGTTATTTTIKDSTDSLTINQVNTSVVGTRTLSEVAGTPNRFSFNVEDGGETVEFEIAAHRWRARCRQRR
jgi:hypothetical protein